MLALKDCSGETRRIFWVLLIGRFVNLVGNSLVFPFLTIFLVERLHASLPVVGLIMAAYGGAQVLSMLVSGELSDRWGRRKVMISSLTLGGLSTLAVGLSHSYLAILISLIAMGFTMPLFQPASMAVIGDLIPGPKLSQAYSAMRMASNAGIIIGPMIGGFLADHSFFWIFALDALSSFLFFSVILWTIPETKPSTAPAALSRPAGMKDVLRDRFFLHVALIWALTSLVYSQLYLVVPAYMHLDLGFAPSAFGYLAAENAVVVVLFQLPITRLIEKWPKLPLIGVGVFFYGLGFATLLTSHRYSIFVLAVFIITIGENIVNPSTSTWVAERAAHQTRGRYMGVFGLANRAGAAAGPLVGGTLLHWGTVPWLGTIAALGWLAAAGFRHVSRLAHKTPASSLSS
ncbi:MAG: MFS transporter [Firmicutes bacterium]|nr:MFS transporter [Bacillota bacterium]